MPPSNFNNGLRPQISALLIVEVLLVIASIYVAVQIRFHNDVIPPDLGVVNLLPKSIFFAFIIICAVYSLGLYELSQRLYFGEACARLFVAYLIGLIAVFTAWYLFPTLVIGRGVIIIAVLISGMSLVLLRLAFLRIIDENRLRRRVLVYGCGERARNLNMLRRRSDRRGFVIVGVVPNQKDDVSEGLTGCDKILQVGTSLLTAAIELKVDEIVVALDDRRGQLPLKELIECRTRGIDVIDLVFFLERETRKIRTDLMDPGWMVFSAGFRVGQIRAATKYIFDALIAATGLILTSPIALVTAVAIKIEDGLFAPVFYRQQRVALHGRLINVVKFRSMIVQAEADGKPVWAEENDPRITKVGHVIRKWRIDEIPQLVNVLRGEMSVVGPRPERPVFVTGLSRAIPYYGDRHSVLPGITGWAQLKYQYGASENDALEKLYYDLYYVKNHSLLLDVSIMLQTIEVMIWGKGAR